MLEALGYAATSADSSLAPFRFTRRTPGNRDVRIEIHYCGVCHTDLHQVRDHWGTSVYPRRHRDLLALATLERRPWEDGRYRRSRGDWAISGQSSRRRSEGTLS